MKKIYSLFIVALTFYSLHGADGPSEGPSPKPKEEKIRKEQEKVNKIIKELIKACPQEKRCALITLKTDYESPLHIMARTVYYSSEDGKTKNVLMPKGIKFKDLFASPNEITQLEKSWAKRLGPNWWERIVYYKKAGIPQHMWKQVAPK